MAEKSRSMLSQLESFRLMNMVKDRYATEAVSDVTFAEVATKELGFTVTTGNVYGARHALGIEAATSPKKTNVEARLDKLERNIKAVLVALGMEQLS